MRGVRARPSLVASARLNPEDRLSGLTERDPVPPLAPPSAVPCPVPRPDVPSAGADAVTLALRAGCTRVLGAIGLSWFLILFIYCEQFQYPDPERRLSNHVSNFYDIMIKHFVVFRLLQREFAPHSYFTGDVVSPRTLFSFTRLQLLFIFTFQDSAAKALFYVIIGSDEPPLGKGASEKRAQATAVVSRHVRGYMNDREVRRRVTRLVCNERYST